LYITTNNIHWNIPKLKANWEVILQELSDKAKNKEIALTFSVSRDSISVIYDEQKLECYQNKYVKYKKQHNRYMGIDLNPDRVGVSIYYDGKVVHSEMFELTSKDQNERKNEISHFCDAIYKLMKHYGISHVGMEDLSVKTKDHKKGKRFNGLVNYWIRTFIQNKIRMICMLSGCIYCNINPAYSSFIGALNYPELGDCCGAASEIARRCAYQKNEFFPRVITKKNLVHRWKEMAGFEYNSWKGLYEEFKKRRLGWRSPPYNSRSSYMGMHSKRLLVYSLGGFVSN